MPEEVRTCPVCERDASHLEPYDIGSGPELNCPHCEWCWGLYGQPLKPIRFPDVAHIDPEHT